MAALKGLPALQLTKTLPVVGVARLLSQLDSHGLCWFREDGDHPRIKVALHPTSVRFLTWKMLHSMTGHSQEGGFGTPIRFWPMPICKLGDPQQKWRQLQTAAFPEFQPFLCTWKPSRCRDEILQGVGHDGHGASAQKKQQGLETQSCWKHTPYYLYNLWGKKNVAKLFRPNQPHPSWNGNLDTRRPRNFRGTPLSSEPYPSFLQMDWASAMAAGAPQKRPSPAAKLGRRGILDLPMPCSVCGWILVISSIR